MLDLDPVKICIGIASSPEVRTAILADRQLDQDAFVDKHSQTLYAHATRAGKGLNEEDARAAAAALWRYIQHLRQVRAAAESASHEGGIQASAERLHGVGKTADAFTLAATERVIHEQRVNQIQLALQNEELRGAMEALEVARARYFDLYDLAPVGYVTLDDAGLIQQSNLVAATLFHTQRFRLVGRPLTRFILAEDQGIFYQCQRQLWSTKDPQSCELRVQTLDGELHWIRLETSLAPASEHEAHPWRAILIDITERKQIETALQQQAATDELTGVANRRHFFVLAADELKRARRLKHSLAVALIDMDDFKRINDTCGHAAGDQALQALTRLCQRNLREIDVFARFGGDEFVVLMPEVTRQQAFDAVERVRQALASQPVELAGHPVVMTISVGIACLQRKPESLDQLLERADQALYEAKTAGRNRVCVADGRRPGARSGQPGLTVSGDRQRQQTAR